MLAVASSLSLSSDFSDSSVSDFGRSSISSVDTTFSEISAQCVCLPVLTAATAQAQKAVDLAQKVRVRDPRAELSYILAAAEDQKEQARGSQEADDQSQGTGSQNPSDQSQNDTSVVDTELQTFSSSPSAVPKQLHKSRFRSRETRANSRFLRLYAHDTAARTQGRLPMVNSAEELALLRKIPALRRFDKQHDLARILALSCKKLWDAVVLPPRSDPLPRACAEGHEYVRVEGNGGLAIERGRNGSKVRPWNPLGKWVPPVGQMGAGQYTVRGWVPRRLRSQTPQEPQV